MPNPLQFLPGALGQNGPQLNYGEVASPVPLSPADPLYVILPDWSRDHPFAVAWSQDHGAALPQVGAACLLVGDSRGFTRCVWWDGDYVSSGTPGTSVLIGKVLVAGNLGSSHTIDLTHTPNEVVTFTGTLNADCTITFVNRAAGCQVYLMITQDGIGGRTLSVSDGSFTTPLIIASNASGLSTVLVTCPDATNLDISILGASGSGISQASADLRYASVSVDAIRFLSATNGNDANNGKSWGSAHKTLAHTVADLSSGGIIYVAPGNYVQAATLTLNGHTLIGLGHGSGNATVPVIQHNFNGDLFSFAAGSQGGGLHGLFLNQSSNGLTGAAIKAASTVGTPTGYLYFSDLVFTGSTGFERNVYLDGSSNAIGIRSIFFDNCLFFGTFLTSQNGSEAAACSENVRVDDGVHVYFTACDIVQAPAAQTQALKLYGTFTEDVFWSGKILGNLYSQAGASSSVAGAQSVLAEARITGAVTFETSSSGHRVIGGIEGTVLNNGDASNVTDKQPWIAPTLQNSWVNTGSGNNTAGYYRDAEGTIHLRGRMSSGTTTANTTLFTLPSGYRPNGSTCNFLIFALNQPGVLTPCWLTIGSTGVVAFQTSLAGAGTSQTISLDGVTFSVN